MTQKVHIWTQIGQFSEVFFYLQLNLLFIQILNIKRFAFYILHRLP